MEHKVKHQAGPEPPEAAPVQPSHALLIPGGLRAQRPAQSHHERRGYSETAALFLTGCRQPATGTSSATPRPSMDARGLELEGRPLSQLGLPVGKPTRESPERYHASPRVVDTHGVLGPRGSAMQKSGLSWRTMPMGGQPSSKAAPHRQGAQRCPRRRHCRASSSAGARAFLG